MSQAGILTVISVITAQLMRELATQQLSEKKKINKKNNCHRSFLGGRQGKGELRA